MNGTASAFAVTSVPMTEEEFERIRSLVKTSTGISLGEHKRDLVVSRLAQRLRKLRLGSFTEYLQFLEQDGGDDELINMINRITTNKTDFFRENHHFVFLRDVVLPEIVNSGASKIRMWSAGCSSGQEPYTLAMVAQEFFAGKSGFDLRILATDLDTNMLHMADQGIYQAEQLAPVDPDLTRKYFTKLDQNHYQVKPVLRAMITFKKFNFITNVTYNIRVPLDFIFCRNVMIYFDAKEKADIVHKFAAVLKPRGYLFVGHSESLMMAKDVFANIGPTVYRKV
ncbi:MAG: protein-glutamate O-methyltransferase [Desulfarculales bacterium]|jgi:chemotaxis protein methyltransferase CheR|nr:protein-glutamate O-methyltransferase [Desulfarculales bacterium]